MTDIRIPGTIAAKILFEKFKMDFLNQMFILTFRIMGYNLPDGDQIGKDVSPECLFYNDIDIHRYAYPEEDTILPFYDIPHTACFLQGIWKQNKNNPDYPYKLDAYVYEEGVCSLVQDWEVIKRLVHCASPHFFFPKMQIEIISESFGIKRNKEQNND